MQTNKKLISSDHNFAKKKNSNLNCKNGNKILRISHFFTPPQILCCIN